MELTPKHQTTVRGYRWDPENDESVTEIVGVLSGTDFQLRALVRDQVSLVICNFGQQREQIIHPGHWLVFVDGRWQGMTSREVGLVFRGVFQ